MTVQARILKSSLLGDARVQESRDGSQQLVFVRLYDEYFSKVYNYARYRCGDAEAADDLTAQTFERALSRLEDYDPQRGPFGAWLFAIARNLVNNHLRTLQRSNCLSLDICEERPAPAASPEERLIQVESETELLAALSRLSERERDLLSLKFAAGLTNRRIAEVMALSEANVGVILYRALQHLRAILLSTEPK
jgi:RNA polymerase sigma-70 factor (ECF subfamily)